MKIKLMCVVLAALVSGAAWAQDVSLREDHPDRYVVIKGDTLWDIAGRFLNHPWQWPAIWQANQQIENPHLIYPGDVISLVYIDGQPRLMVDRSRPTVRLSPSIRATTRPPISPIPHNAIEGLIRNMRLVTEAEFDTLPYVIANNERRMRATFTDNTYARNVNGQVGQYFRIMRASNVYFRRDGEVLRKRVPQSKVRHPRMAFRPENRIQWDYAPRRGDIVGYELYQVAEAMLAKKGEVSVLSIATQQEPVQEGDLVLPIDDPGYQDQYLPRPPDLVPEGLRVLAVQGDNNLVGHLRMVSINGGSLQGIEPGHVFSAFNPGHFVRDRVKYPQGSLAAARTWQGDFVNLPDEFSAHIMVFRVFDEVSYGLVMSGPRPVREFDRLRHPDETL